MLQRQARALGASPIVSVGDTEMHEMPIEPSPSSNEVKKKLLSLIDARAKNLQRQSDLVDKIHHAEQLLDELKATSPQCSSKRFPYDFEATMVSRTNQTYGSFVDARPGKELLIEKQVVALREGRKSLEEMRSELHAIDAELSKVCSTLSLTSYMHAIPCL